MDKKQTMQPMEVSDIRGYINKEEGLAGYEITVLVKDNHSDINQKFVYKTWYSPREDTTSIAYVFPFIGYGILNPRKIRAKNFHKKMKKQVDAYKSAQTEAEMKTYKSENQNIQWCLNVLNNGNFDIIKFGDMIVVNYDFAVSKYDLLVPFDLSVKNIARCALAFHSESAHKDIQKLYSFCENELKKSEAQKALSVVDKFKRFLNAKSKENQKSTN